MLGKDTQPLTMLEFEPKDHDIAERIAKHLGYAQTVYTSTSGLWGLFCVNENPERWRGNRNALQERCIIKTREMGFLIVQTTENLHLADDGRPE